MKRNKSLKVLSIVFLLALFASFGGAVPPQTEIQVEITAPERDGMQVGKEKEVKGTADIPGGTYLWVLAHRIRGYKKDWWPQNEVEIDPITKKWDVLVAFGGPQDIGYEFEIAAIVVNEKENATLHDYRRRALETGHWPPIPMPPTVAPPVIRTVIKAD